MALAADRRRLHRRRLAVRPARGARAPARLAHPWLLLLIFSSVSVAGNVAHGAPTPVGRLVAAVPPIALVLAFDLLHAATAADPRRLRRSLARRPQPSAGNSHRPDNREPAGRAHHRRRPGSPTGRPRP